MKVLSPDTHAAVDAAKGEAVELCAAVLHDTLLAAHRADAKITYEEIAGCTGAKPAHVGEWCNPLSGRTVALYRVAMMGARVAPAVLRALADAIEARAKGKGGAADLRKIVCDVMARVGELASSVNAGVADGTLDGGEIVAIEADVHRIRAALSQIEAGLATARAALRGER